MKNILTSAFIFLAVTAFAQDTKKDTTVLDYGARIYDARIGRYMSTDSNSLFTYQNHEIEVAPEVVKAVANSACDCINKLNLKSLITQEQKKTALNNCLQQAANENEDVIAKDKNATTTKGYNVGKQYGHALGKKIGQLLNNNCPNFLLVK